MNTQLKNYVKFDFFFSISLLLLISVATLQGFSPIAWDGIIDDIATSITIFIFIFLVIKTHHAYRLIK